MSKVYSSFTMSPRCQGIYKITDCRDSLPPNARVVKEVAAMTHEWWMERIKQAERVGYVFTYEVGDVFYETEE